MRVIRWNGFLHTPFNFIHYFTKQDSGTKFYLTPFNFILSLPIHPNITLDKFTICIIYESPYYFYNIVQTSCITVSLVNYIISIKNIS